MDWVAENQGEIELHFLPKYSPGLNAQDRIWKGTRRRMTHNRFFWALQTLKDDLSEGSTDTTAILPHSGHWWRPLRKGQFQRVAV